MTAVVCTIALLVAMVVVPVIITILKGKYWTTIIGVLVHICWWWGAIRLAKPDSY